MMKSKNLKSSERGFTLIELMIVVAIIGILAAIAIPKFADLVKKSQEGKTRGNLTTIRSALSIYYGDNEGSYPTDDTSSLTTNSKYLKAIPNAVIPGFGFAGHSEGSSVSLADSVTTSTSSENGTWGYANNNGNVNWGHFWVYCTHNDSKSVDWSSR